MNEDFSELRRERRSFFCHNKMWEELKKKAKEDFPISSFIRQAIFEKLVREEPEKRDYFEEMI
ncbi:MAG: hypothetical protein PHU51_05605 [Candidatus Nanoarchaeia archaeon]|nr:hypothetical protein [Candidatus Nanoarchaeia archaeon]